MHVLLEAPAVKSHTFAFSAGSVVMYEIWIQKRAQHIVTEDMIHRLIRTWDACHHSSLSSLPNNKSFSAIRHIRSFFHELLDLRCLQQMIHLEEMSCVLPWSTFHRSCAGLIDEICVCINSHNSKIATLIGSTALAGSVTAALYRYRKDSSSFPIVAPGLMPGGASVKSRRTPLALEALLLFALPLLFTLPKLAANQELPCVSFRFLRKRLSDCRRRLMRLNSFSISSTICV